ncbi:MAG: hypothetical protein NT123_10105 [Proteobacteria bacterium]|nr:hypothetical protein [Pseudomonadota bacterium]
MVRELHAGGLERLAQGDADILAVLAVDHYFSAWKRDGQANGELHALLLRPVQGLGNHAAGQDAVADLPQLARFVADVTFQLIRTRDSTQNDFHRAVHCYRSIDSCLAALAQAQGQPPAGDAMKRTNASNPVIACSSYRVGISS